MTFGLNGLHRSKEQCLRHDLEKSVMFLQILSVILLEKSHV